MTKKADVSQANKALNLKIISAGAGSGKTYRLTQEMVELLDSGVRASGIIATTFTAKAAAELQERVRTKLLEQNMSAQADDLSNALIGTVHGLGVKLLKRFAYEAGVSPAVSIIADEDQQVLFNQSLSMVLRQERVEQMEGLCDRLGMNKKGAYDWRKEIKSITEVARANGFSLAQLEASKVKSYEHFEPFLGRQSPMSLEAFQIQLQQLMEETIERVRDNEDETKKTKTAMKLLGDMLRDLRLRGRLYWWEMVKIAKLGVGAKSRDDIADLVEFAQRHEQLDAFRKDIKAYIYLLFELASEALQEFDRYKKQRGLIDYTDMEVYIKSLLDHPDVRTVLSEELDLLMVDEFQDTSPIQLEIFLKLAHLAKFSVWVGDPKQSIYGFRGAEPELMQAIIQKMGGVKEEDIQTHSWRSRQDIVYCTNALFTKAFSDLPVEQVALEAQRAKKGNDHFQEEPIEADTALMHWHFELIEKGTTNQEWMNQCIAEEIAQLIDNKKYILPKGATKGWRTAKPGDVAVLCRSNKECLAVAEALHRVGLKAAIARSGLLETAESKLILACLKYLLTQKDTLAIAEIMLLASQRPIENILEERLQYLNDKEQGLPVGNWASTDTYIKQLDKLRTEIKELSGSEILNLLLNELDIRRIVAKWGNLQQRFDNIDVLRKMADEYEERCNRLQTAASLGGLLLWLNEIENNGDDRQASGENEEAVNVMTYHRSKGLEFSVLVCHSLEQNLRADLWGASIVSENEEIDLNDVLSGRWLRYWVNPYADQYRRTALEERLLESEAYALKRQQALAEEARLMYVGITRARDYLVFPTRNKPSKWLNRVWQEGREDYPTLTAGEQDSPWHWKEEILLIQSRSFQKDKELEWERSAPSKTIDFIEAAAGQQAFPKYKIDLREENWEDRVQVTIRKHPAYAKELTCPDEDEKYALGKAFKAFLIADHTDDAPEKRLKMAQDHIDRFQLDDSLSAAEWVEQSDKFYQKMALKSSQEAHRKYVIYLHHGDRLFDTVLDFLYVSETHVRLIQNSGFAGEAKRYPKHAKESVGTWSFLSKKALQQLFPNRKIETWVHFVLGGTCVQVESLES
ncbi:MAG: UvrD-helicase domain-containing protein [Bacteroidota bacterium]